MENTSLNSHGCSPPVIPLYAPNFTTLPLSCSCSTDVAVTCSGGGQTAAARRVYRRWGEVTEMDEVRSPVEATRSIFD